MTQAQLGWDSRFEEEFEPFRKEGLTPARVIAEHRERYILHTGEAEIAGEVSGRFMFTAITPSDYPKTGDWVAVSEFPAEQKAIYTALCRAAPVFQEKRQALKLWNRLWLQTLTQFLWCRALTTITTPSAF